MADQNVEALKADLRAQSKLQRESVPSSNPSLPAPAAPSHIPGGSIQTGHYAGDSKYDKNIAVADIPNIGAIRHERQSGLAQTVNMLNQAITGEIAGGMIEGVGYLLDVADSAKILGGKNEEWGNWMSDIGKGIKDWTREVTPIYKDPNAPDFDPMSYSWWMSHMPSVASTLSLMIPAVGTMTAVNRVAKIMKIGEGLIKGGKAMGMGQKGLKIANNIIQGTGTAVVSRHMESMMEATGTWENVYDEAISKMMNDGDARRLASDAAHRNYALNWVALAQDIPQYMLLGKAFPKLTSIERLKPKTLTKSLFAPFKTKAGLITMDAAWEGVEEGYQFMTDEESKYLVFQRAGFVDEKPFNERLHQYTSDGEFWSAAFFGALGGAMMQTAGKPISQAISGDPAALKSSFTNLGDRVGKVFKKKNTDSEVGDTGAKNYEATIKSEDIKNWGAQYSAVQHNMRRAASWGSEQSKKDAAERTVETMAIRAAESDKIHLMQDMFESMKNPSEEDLKTYGFDKMSEEDIRDFQKNIPVYQETAKRVESLWAELANELAQKGEFINVPEAKSREKVSAAVDLAVRTERIGRNIEANNTEIAKIEQEVPKLRTATPAVRDVLRAELQNDSLKKLHKSMKARYDAGEMSGPEKVGYESSFKDIEEAIKNNDALREKAQSELKPKDKKDLKLIRGSVRFPKYKTLIGSNASLQQYGLLNAYEEGALMTDIEETAKKFNKIQNDLDTEVEKKEAAENAAETIAIPNKQTEKEAVQKETTEIAPPQKAEPADQASLDEALDRESSSNQDTTGNVDYTNSDDTAPTEELQPTESPENKGRKSILDGSAKTQDGVVVDTGAVDPTDERIYGNDFLPEVFPFDPGESFERWANPRYTNNKTGAANLQKDLSILSSFIDTAIAELKSNGSKVPIELEELAINFRNGKISPTEKLTVKGYIELIDKYSVVPIENLGSTEGILYSAILDTYNYLFDYYGPRQHISAKEVKDHHKKVKDKVLKDNRNYSKSEGSNENDNSGEHFFTPEKQYAMAQDPVTNVWFVVTDKNGQPITNVKNEKGISINWGDKYKELDWDNLNTNDYTGAKVYFEYDIGTQEGTVYNERSGDHYNHTEIPKYMDKKNMNDNFRASHVINKQKIWLVTYENNDFTGKRTVLGSVPAGSTTKSHVANLRAALNMEFEKQFNEGNIISGVPSTDFRGKLENQKTRFIRAETTTIVKEQLPGRLHANPNPEGLIMGADILKVIPPEDLHIVIWNEYAGDNGRFEGTGPIEEAAVGKDQRAIDIMNSLKNGNTSRLTNGAAYVMLKSSKPGHYIPTRLYNYLEPGTYMNKIINMMMEFRDPKKIWNNIKDDLKELLYSTYDIRPHIDQTTGDRSIILSHTTIDGKTVLRTIKLTGNTNENIKKDLTEALTGRFAMVSKYRVNTPGYNQLLIEGKESINDPMPAPFISIDINSAEENLNPDGQRVYTHSTKFKIAMPNMQQKIVIPTPAERIVEDEFGETVEFEEVSPETIKQKKTESVKNLDHENTGVQDNSGAPDEDLSNDDMLSRMRRAAGNTKDLGNSGAMKPSDERTLRKERIKNDKSIISQAEIEWFQAMFPGVPLSILPTVNHVVTTGGEKAWAVFQDAAVKVVQKAPKGVLYHEAFHAVFVLSLTDKQRADILAEARNMYPEPSSAELERIKKEVVDITTDAQAGERYYEEMLAEEFREYALMTGTPARTLGQKIAKWFKQLYAFGRRLARSKVSVKSLFYDIHNGRYKIKTLPAYAKNVAAYMSQNSPATLSVTETDQAIKEINSMVMGRVSQIAKDQFGTPRPHISQVLQVIDGYNVDPENPGEPFDVRTPYIQSAAIYLDITKSLIKRLDDNISSGVISKDDPKVKIYYKVVSELVDMDSWIAGEPILGPLARAASIRLFQDYGVKVRITGVETKRVLTAEDLLGEVPEETTDFDNQNDTGVIKESWSVKSGQNSKKDTASFRVRYMLATIPMINKNTLKPIMNFMDEPMFVDQSLLYNKLQAALSIEKGNFGKESMMEILHGMVKSYPEVQAVIDQLQGDSVLSAEFLSTMTTTNTTYIMLLEKLSPDGSGVEYRLIESNRRTLDKMILNDWKESLNNPTTSPFNKEIMSEQVRVELATKAIKEIESLKVTKRSNRTIAAKDAQKFSAITRDLGFYTSGNIIESILNTESADIAVEYLDHYVNILTSIKKGVNPFEESITKQMVKAGHQSKAANVVTNASKLAYTNAQYEINLYEAGFTNVEKNKIFAHSNPNFISRRIAKLGHPDINVSAAEKLKLQKDPFYKGNYILRTLLTNKDDKSYFKYAMLDGLKEQGKSKGKTHKDMGEKLSYITTINAWLNNGNGHGWYKVSTLSDSPSSLYVKGRKESTSRAKIELSSNIQQEAERIDRVNERHASGVTPIENYDIDPEGRWEAQGNKFLFFPFMNEVIPKNYKGGIAKWVIENPQLVDAALQDYMNKTFKDFKEKVMASGATDEHGNNLNFKALDKAIGGRGTIVDKRLGVDSLLEQYYWNSVLFNVNMIQITSGDIAFYKSNEDFQKRHKQVYSPGLVIDTKAEYTDEAGKITTVGSTYNNLYLEDNDIDTSVNIEALRKGLQESVNRGNLSTNDMYSILAKYGYGHSNKLGKEQFLFLAKGDVFTIEKIKGKKTLYNIVSSDGTIQRSTLPKGGIMYKINSISETDGQAYITLDRFKKIYIGLGRWNEQYEQSYKRAKEGKATPEDISMIFRPLKPFYYSMEWNPETELWMPTQNKNSEFVLLPQMTKNSKKLDTLRKYMDKNEIDAVNFHTAVKVGAHGIAKWSDIESNKKTVKAQNVNPAKSNIKGNVLIHQGSNEDYKLQQETADHYQDHSMKFGVQIAKLGLADLNHTDGVTYTLQDGSKLSADDLTQAFQDNMSAGVVTDYYYEAEKFNNIEELQKFLIQQMRDNGFGDEVESAFELRESTIAGKKIFKVSLNNPLYSNDTEKLLNAAFRNSITTRRINGGQFVQVSSFGFSKDLRLITNDKGGLEAMEVYLPWWSKEYFPLKENGDVDIEKIRKEAPELLELIGYRIPTEDKYSMAPLRVKAFLPKAAGGSIILPSDITTISGSDFDIDKLYVMIPKFKIRTGTKAGKEVTRITSDKYNKWDTSTNEGLYKLYQNRQGQAIKIMDKRIEALEILAVKNIHKREKLKKKLDAKGPFTEDIDQFMQNQLDKEIQAYKEGKKDFDIKVIREERRKLISAEEFKEKHGVTPLEFLETWTGTDQQLIDSYPGTPLEFIARYRNTPAAFFNSKNARNNHMIDILRAVLQHEDTFDKIVNSGSFQMYKDDRDYILKLRGKKQQDMNITLPHNDIEFSLRNSAGGKLRGIAANHNTNHAIMQHTDVHLFEAATDNKHNSAVKFWVPDKNGTLVLQTGTSLNNTTYEYMEDGVWKTAYISKNLASIVAMVMDNAKDPVSGEINLNEYTINVFELIMRTGFHHRLASMFIAHPMIVKASTDYFNAGATRKDAERVVTNIINKELLPALQMVDSKASIKEVRNYIKTGYAPSQDMLKRHIENGEAFTRGLKALAEISKKKKAAGNKPTDIGLKEEYDKIREQGNILAMQYGYTSFADMYNKLFTKANLLEHMAVLDHFSKLHTTGEELSRAISLMRSDSTGLGASMIEGTMMTEKYENLASYPKVIVGLEKVTAPESSYADTNVLKPINIPVPNNETGEDFTRVQWMGDAYSTPHTFYEFGVVKPTKLMEQHYIWNTPAFSAIRERILLNSGLEAFSAEHIRHINYSLYGYIADGFKFFNITQQEKTDLVKNFPQRFYQFKLDNRDNKEIESNVLLRRLLVRTDNDHPRIQFDNGLPLSKLEQEEVRREWQRLFDSEHRQLALDLAKYSFHTLGFIFTPYSFSNLLNNHYYTDVMKYQDMTFDEHILQMREDGGLLNGPNFNEFYDQFMMNHTHQSEYIPTPREFQGGSPAVELTLTYNSYNKQYFYTDSFNVVHPKDYTVRTYFVKGVETKVLYRLEGKPKYKGGVPTAKYTRVNKLGVPNFLYEYRYEVPGNAMSSIIDSNNLTNTTNNEIASSQFFLKDTINVRIAVGEENVIEHEARRILTTAMEGFRLKYKTKHTLDSFVVHMLNRMMKDTKGPNTVEGIHEVLGRTLYEQLPDNYQFTLDTMIPVDPSFSSTEQYKYKMIRLGSNMLSNIDQTKLTDEVKMYIKPKPDMGNPQSPTTKKNLLGVMEKGRVGGPEGTSVKKTINIYAGTGENVELSNFAHRPFKTSSLTLFTGITFNTVEGAFQAAKYQYSSEDYLNTFKEISNKLSKATGAEAKRIGRQIKGLNIEKWNTVSPKIMKDLIKESFEQNPNALEQLLATGNAELTHTQDKGKWGKLFPKLLMEVRDELGGKLVTKVPVKTTGTKELKISGSVGSDQNTASIAEGERKVLAVPGNENRVDSYSNLQALVSEYKKTGRPVTATMVLKNMRGVEKTVAVTYHGYGTVNLANAALSKRDSKAILASLRKSASMFKLSEDESRYILHDEQGNPIAEYMRVSEFANGKSKGVSKDAVTIGNAIDNIVRDIMATKDSAQEIKAIDAGHKKYSGMMGKDTYFQIASQVAKLKNIWIAEGKVIISDKIILHSDKMGPNKDQKVAGEIDLMTIDKQGRIEIIDTKTIRNLANYYNVYEGTTKYKKHSRQINTYAILLNNTYGLSTSSLSILPIKVEYENTTLNAASLIASPKQPDGSDSVLPYRIELPAAENINNSRLETWFEALSALRNEKNPAIKKGALSFNEGKDERHVFTFDTNGSIGMQLDTKKDNPAKRVSVIPDTSGIKVKQFITEVSKITPILTNTVRVGSMFSGLNKQGHTVKVVINGFSNDQVHMTNISEGKTLTMSINKLNDHITKGNMTHYGTYPLIEYNGEYYMYDHNTYYPLNPSARMSEEIEEYRKEKGAENFNSLKSHILQEMAGILNKNKVDKVADLDTEHIAKYCRKVKS